MLPQRRDTKWSPSTTIHCTLFLLLPSSPVWAIGPNPGGDNYIAAIAAYSSALLGLGVLPGSLIGANLSFADGKRMRCVIGAVLGAIPAMLAFAMWVGSLGDDDYVAGLVFAVSIVVIPITAAVVGLPVGLITHSVRSRLRQRKTTVPPAQDSGRVESGIE